METSVEKDNLGIERRGNCLMIGFRRPSRGQRHHQNEWSVEKSQERVLASQGRDRLVDIARVSRLRWLQQKREVEIESSTV